MDRKLTLVEHLDELRRRIIISLGSVVIASIFSFPLASKAFEILKRPASGLIEKLAFFSPQEAFAINLRISFFSGLVISVPILLYQVWAFVAPAVEERLKSYIGLFILLCTILFVAGTFFAYFVLIHPALKFLLSFAGGDLEPVISASKYISFVTSLMLGCGLVFQMPILSLLLTRLRVINAGLLRKKYKYAIVIIFIAAAIVTPTPDAFNMFILAGPMILLYEISIWISFLARPRMIGG